MEVLKYRKDANSPWQDIIAIVGPKGPAGVDGKDYILTEEDKINIAELVLGLLPSGEEVAY